MVYKNNSLSKEQLEVLFHGEWQPVLRCITNTDYLKQEK